MPEDNKNHNCLLLGPCFHLSHDLWLSQLNPAVALPSAFSPETSTLLLCLQQDCKHRASSSGGSSLNTDSGSHGCVLLQLQEKWEHLHCQWEGSRLLVKSEVRKYTSSTVYPSTAVSQKYNLVNVLCFLVLCFFHFGGSTLNRYWS